MTILDRTLGEEMLKEHILSLLFLHIDFEFLILDIFFVISRKENLLASEGTEILFGLFGVLSDGKFLLLSVPNK